MNTRLLNIATLALVLLPIIAPMLPAVQIAAAQTDVGAEIVDTSGNQTSQTTANVTIGDYVVFQIYDANASTENITAQIYVNGIENNVSVGYIGAPGTYQGKIEIVQAGQFIKVKYYYFVNDTGTYVDMGYLNGSLEPYTNVTIRYTSPYSNETVEINVTYIPPPAQFYLEIFGRNHGGVYWIPRLGNCSQLNTSMYYNAYEWMIKSNQKAFNTGQLYEVVISANNIATDISVSSDVIVFNATDNYTLVPVNDTEAEKIKAFIFQLDTIAEPWYIEGNNYANPQTIGDKLMVSAEVYEDGNLKGTTAPVEVRLFVSIAQISVSTISFATPTITITVVDADSNLNTMAAEHLPYPGALAPVMELLQDNAPAMSVEFDETGNNTGVFTAQLTIFNLYEAGLISETDNTIHYNFTEIRVDDPQTTCLCYDLGEFKAQYYFGNAYTAEGQVILRNIVRCCPPLKITLMIEDADLDLPGPTGQTVAIASVPAGSKLFNIVAQYYYNNTSTDVPAVRFTVYLEDEAGNKYNVTASQDINIYFEKAAPGIVRATIDLSKVDWQAVNKLAVAQGHKLTKLVVYVYDLFNPNLTIRKIEASAVLQNVTIETDREVLPISFRIVESTLTRQTGVTSLASCPGCYPWITDTEGSSQVVHVKIYDPGANRNCCSIDTISHTKLNVTLILQRPSGKTYTLVNAANGSISIPLYAIETNGTWKQYGTCYIEWTDLSETGANTSIFTGTLKIYSIITIYDNAGNAVGTIRVAGCPSVWLEKAKLRLTYISPAVGYSVYTMTFAVKDAELNISKNVVRYGDEVTITVTDPDANLDNRVNDSVMVEVSFYCPLSRSSVIKEIWLHETDPSSGVFKGSLTINSSLAGACNDLYCASMDVIYVDRTPYVETTINYGLQQLERNISLSNNSKIAGLLIFAECDCNKVLKIQKMDYHPEKGTIEIYYKFPDNMTSLAPFNSTWIEVTNKVIPAFLDTELKIVIKDADLNKRTNAPDALQGQLVSIEVPGITPGPVSLNMLELGDLRETGANTGEFTKVVTLRQLFEALKTTGYITVPPGKTDEQVYSEILANLVASKQPIKIYYHDGQAACQAQVCGNVAPADIEAGVRVVDITGNISIVDSVTKQPHNDSIYRCGCVIGNCPSATGDVIDIIVKDLSLLKYTGGYLDVVGNITMQLSMNGTVRPLIYGGFDKLKFDHYENITIDGVKMPVPVFQAKGVVIYCQQPLATARAYIVAPIGSRVYFTYIDPVNATGARDLVTTSIGIGIPGLARNITQTITIPTSKLELRVFNGTAFVKTATIQRGQPAAIYVPLNYDPIALRTIVGGNTFAVLMVIRDSAGKVLLFQYTYVTIGQTSVTFSLTAANTESLQPGKYTIEVYAVTNIDALVRISPITPLQVTVQ